MYKLIIALVLVCFMASCSQTEMQLRVRVLERNTISLVTAQRPSDSHNSPYLVGDTVWVNMKTNQVDNADSTAMLAVVEQFY